MKKLILFLTAVVCSLDSNAQLKADAGADKVWCLGFPPSLGPVLGGTPAADFGTLPYSYEWKTINSTYPAQLFLDTVTLEHPTLTSKPGAPRVDSVYFELTVTDGNAATARDTVKVYLTRWICPLSSAEIGKGPSDTVTLRTYECQSVFGPNIFMYWTPGQYLIDSTVRSARCWTPVSTQYYAYVKNQLGCVSISSCYVEVQATGVNPQPRASDGFSIYPNPINELSQIVCRPEWLGGTLRIYSIEGKLVRTVLLKNAETSVASLMQQSAGVYFYYATSPKGEVNRGKITIL